MTVDEDLRRGVDALHRVEVEVPPYRRLQRRQRGRVTAVVVAFLAIVSIAGLVLSASGDGSRESIASGGPDTAEPTRPPETGGPGPDLAPEEPSPEELERFCVLAAPFSGEVPEAYVGSAEHVADITSLTAVAPAEIRPALETYRDFLAGGGVDPTDPDSNLTENWPPEVQAATEASSDYIASHC